jgi:DNA-binding MarR family transcriptional regulator
VFLFEEWIQYDMAKDGIGRPRDVTCEDVLTAFNDVDKPVATGTLLAEMLDVSKQSVLRRLQELEEKGRVERWKVGSRAVVWWPTEES